MKCFIRTKFLMQTRSHTDRGSKGFIVWRRLNRQVTLAVYFFLPLLSFSSRTCPNAWRGGQATFEAWKALIVDVLFLTILFNILVFRLVQIRRDVLAGSLLPLASLLSCTVITMAGNCLSGICDRFPVDKYFWRRYLGFLRKVCHSVIVFQLSRSILLVDK